MANQLTELSRIDSVSLLHRLPCCIDGSRTGTRAEDGGELGSKTVRIVQDS
jgi:hypothetical protein